MKTEQEIRKQIEWERTRQIDAVKYNCPYINAQCEGSLWALGWVLNKDEQKDGVN